MSNKLYKQWINLKNHKYFFLQELDTFLRNNNIQLDIYETNPHYAIRSAFEYWLDNNEEASQFDNWKDAFYTFFSKNIDNELFFSKGYKKIFVDNLKECVEGLIDYLHNNHDDFLPRIKSAIDYLEKTENKEAFNSEAVLNHIYHIENTVYTLIYEESLPTHIEKNIKYRDETASLNQYGNIYTVDDFFLSLVIDFYEHAPINASSMKEQDYFYIFLDKDARAFTIESLYPRTCGHIINALEIVLAGKSYLRISKNVFNNVLELANKYMEDSKEISFTRLQILLYNKLKNIVEVDYLFKYYAAIQTAFNKFKQVKEYLELPEMEQADIEGKLLGEFRKKFDEFDNSDDTRLYHLAEEFINNNLISVINNDIVRRTCRELNLTQKELADTLGASEGTVRNWSSSNELPQWAVNFIETLKENKKNKDIADTIKKLFELIK